MSDDLIRPRVGWRRYRRRHGEVEATPLPRQIEDTDGNVLGREGDWIVQEYGHDPYVVAADMFTQMFEEVT